MRRILVPLDGSELAESILPDARRLAGPNGELVLLRDAGWVPYNPEARYYSYWTAKEESDEYLHAKAEDLREHGLKVQVRKVLLFDPVWAIEESATLLHVDMIACATHGRGPLGRLVRGGVAWRILAHSPVPVLLRHPDLEGEHVVPHLEPRQRRILVPLDGSAFAEKALPLAQQLAFEWEASIHLLRVVPGAPAAASAAVWGAIPVATDDDCAVARDYLEHVAARLISDVDTEVVVGSPVSDTIVEVAQSQGVTDVVVSSHGRTGLSRTIVGSAADHLIQHLHLPILVVPALASGQVHETVGMKPEEAATRP